MDAVPDTSSREGSIIAASVIMLLLAAFTASLRFYTRWTILSGLKADDWLVLAALVSITDHRHPSVLNKMAAAAIHTGCKANSVVKIRYSLSACR